MKKRSVVKSNAASNRTGHVSIDNVLRTRTPIILST